jgi:hypothetical protein
MGIYPAFGGSTIRDSVSAPFAISGQSPTAMANVGISSAWYIVAIAIGAIIHALIYVILIRTSQGGGLKATLKETFTFHKKTKKETDVVKTSKFDN